MHLAFFSSIVPDDNPISGFEVANDVIIAGLRELGHRVSIFGFSQPRQYLSRDKDTHVFSTLPLENADAGFFQKIGWVGRAIVKGLPISAAKITQVPYIKLQQEMARAGKIDGHIINSYQMAAAYPKLLEKPSLYVAHNVEHKSAYENAEHAESALERFLYRRDARLLKAIEAGLCESARYVWCLSEADRQLHGLSGEKSGVLPLVAPQRSDCRDQSTDFTHDIGLIGTWTWQPNLVGLKWFAEEVVPKLPEHFRIAIAGNVPEGAIASSSQISLLGRVENAHEFLKSVRVVPLVSRGGTGVQLKTIEAFQSGLACVATTSSLRGINIVPENCVTSDDPAVFASSLISMVNKSREGTLRAVDGTAFHSKQKLAMHAALERGLAKLA